MEKQMQIAVAIAVLALIGAVAYFLLNGGAHFSANTTSTVPPAQNRSAGPTTVSTTISTIVSTAQSTATTTAPANLTQTTMSTANFIVSTPVNLSQISQISKFRSCEGHDYSGYDVQDFQETQRSMKHYFAPLQQLLGSTSQVQEFAPFNGTVQSIITEQTPVGKQVWIGHTQSGPQGGYPAPGIWNAVFFHLNPLPGITVGSHVSAGELIGYANLTSPIQDFDIALEQYNGSSGVYRQVLDSIFLHMSPSVLANFSSRGVNASGMVIPKAYRDSNPCDFNTFNPNDSVSLR
ncbi:MAG: hypothetical protein KGH71_01620 [Candidatus Micrarchaeota archaeon]|nr:hypothetical protein [Candidatus Micrarchaeota archaeon]